MKTYVIGGYIPKGGTYMAYHLGRILFEYFGRECLVIKVGSESSRNGIFDYRHDFEAIDLNMLAKSIRPDDILIINPSFSDSLLGLRFPGKKLMYIQDFKTFRVIDGFCTHYVSVSECVRHFIKHVYNMDTPVIPAFIRHDLIPPVMPWLERPANSVLAVGKLHFTEFLQVFRKTMEVRHPDVKLDITTNPGLPHGELLKKMSENRYLLSLSACEGFGLQPLEAMACGCAVAGFSGCGGREFMRPGINCESTDYPDFSGLADRLADLLKNSDRAAEMARRGLMDAKAYDLKTFDKRWKDYFSTSSLIVAT
jgi:hypothetical protein